MESSKACRIPKSATTEDTAFWQRHIHAQAESQLSKSAYCHLHQVDYGRFIYWSGKAAADSRGSPKPGLVKVKLAADESLSAGVLCTLPLKRGGCLHIHDVRALNFIFDKLN